MFQFRRFPAYAYLIQRTLIRYCRTGFPHSDISGSQLMCSSPKLFAACHVLRRLLMPRHPPCALSSLTSRSSNYAGTRSYYEIVPNFRFPQFLRFLLPCFALSYYCSVFKVRAPVCQNQIPKFDQDRTPVSNFNMVGPSGLEPPTSRLSVVRSSQLSYGPILVEISGIEPLTPCLQSRCSPS